MIIKNILTVKSKNSRGVPNTVFENKIIDLRNYGLHFIIFYHNRSLPKHKIRIP